MPNAASPDGFNEDYPVPPMGDRLRRQTHVRTMPQQEMSGPTKPALLCWANHEDCVSAARRGPPGNGRRGDSRTPGVPLYRRGARDASLSHTA